MNHPERSPVSKPPFVTIDWACAGTADSKNAARKMKATSPAFAIELMPRRAHAPNVNIIRFKRFSR